MDSDDDLIQKLKSSIFLVGLEKTRRFAKEELGAGAVDYSDLLNKAIAQCEREKNAQARDELQD